MIEPQGYKRPREDEDDYRGWTQPQGPGMMGPGGGGGGVGNGMYGGHGGHHGAGGPPGGVGGMGMGHMEDIKPQPWKKTATGNKYEVTLLVPAAALGLLIGKQHQTMQELSNQSGARIRVQDIQDVVDGSHERGISLEGPWESVLVAEKAILEKLKDRHETMWKEYGIDDGLESGPDPTQIIRWLIPADLCGLLIGKRGAGLQAITNETGAKCRVSNEEEMPPGCPDRIVYIVGKADQRDRALRVIQQKCGGRALDNPKAIQVQIPIKTVGYILGHKGDHVRQIREQAGTRIQLRSLAESETGVGTIKVELEGTPAQIEAAKGLLKGRVQSWKGNEMYTHMLGHSGQGTDLDKEIALRFAMHRALVGHLIGKGGSIIRDMMTATGTLIKVLQEDRSHTRSSDQRPVLVVGTLSSVLDAQKRILDQLSTAPPTLLAQIQALNTGGGVPGFPQQAPFMQPYGYQQGQQGPPPQQQPFPATNPGVDFANYGYSGYGYGQGGAAPGAYGAPPQEPAGGLGGPPMPQGPPPHHQPAAGQPYPTQAQAGAQSSSAYGRYSQQQQQVPSQQQYPVPGDHSGPQGAGGASAYGYGAPYGQQQQGAQQGYGSAQPSGGGAYGGSSGNGSYPQARPPQHQQHTPTPAPYPPAHGYGSSQQGSTPAAPGGPYGGPAQQQRTSGYSQYRGGY